MSSLLRFAILVAVWSQLGLVSPQTARRDPGPAPSASGAVPLCISKPPSCPAWIATNDQPDSYFALVATAGDVNGDGFADVLVGAPQYDNGETDEGRAYLYLGSATGLAASPAWTAESDQADARFGGGGAQAAGDVNGDGYDDVLVGAYFFDNGQNNEGRAFLYLGSATGLAASPAWTAEGDQASAYFGLYLGRAGDVNGDGYGDVFVSAPYFQHGQQYEGRAYVYLGSASGLATSPAWTAEGNQTLARFGYGGGVGDVNGDGYDDVVVGAPGFGGGRGRASLYLGSPSGLSVTPSWTMDGSTSGEFGPAVAAGDVNGDGYDDVLVSERSADSPAGYDFAGHALLFLGSPTGLSSVAAWSVRGEEDGAYLGADGAAGDLNGDGFDDWCVSANQGGVGRMFVYLGSSGPLSTCPAWTAIPDPGRYLGGQTAGDVNGDGYNDLITSSSISYPSYAGFAALYMGSPFGLSRSASYPGDGINKDTIEPVDAILGSSWSAPLAIGHAHGTHGSLALLVRSATINGPNFTSPIGGRLTEVLVGGQTLATIPGSHNGTLGDIPPQRLPADVSLLSAPWAAQYIVTGGGFADLSQAVYGIVFSCP